MWDYKLTPDSFVPQWRSIADGEFEADSHIVALLQLCRLLHLNIERFEPLYKTYGDIWLLSYTFKHIAIIPEGVVGFDWSPEYLKRHLDTWIDTGRFSFDVALEKHRYKDTATAGIDAGLGFSELLNVL